MKYVCLGYHDEAAWARMSEADRDVFVRDCLDYDDTLRLSGNLIQAQALQPARTGATLRSRNGQVLICDGPFIDTNEQLGGIMMIEASDLSLAIHLLSKHPCLGLGGALEIRPINKTLCEEIERRERNISGQSATKRSEE